MIFIGAPVLCDYGTLCDVQATHSFCLSPFFCSFSCSFSLISQSYSLLILSLRYVTQGNFKLLSALIETKRTL